MAGLSPFSLNGTVGPSDEEKTLDDFTIEDLMGTPGKGSRSEERSQNINPGLYGLGNEEKAPVDPNSALGQMLRSGPAFGPSAGPRGSAGQRGPAATSNESFFGPATPHEINYSLNYADNEDEEDFSPEDIGPPGLSSLGLTDLGVAAQSASYSDPALGTTNQGITSFSNEALDNANVAGRQGFAQSLDVDALNLAQEERDPFSMQGYNSTPAFGPAGLGRAALSSALSAIGLGGESQSIEAPAPEAATNPASAFDFGQPANLGEPSSAPALSLGHDLGASAGFDDTYGGETAPSYSGTTSFSSDVGAGGGRDDTYGGPSDNTYSGPTSFSSDVGAGGGRDDTYGGSASASLSNSGGYGSGFGSSASASTAAPGFSSDIGFSGGYNDYGDDLTAANTDAAVAEVAALTGNSIGLEDIGPPAANVASFDFGQPANLGMNAAPAAPSLTTGPAMRSQNQSLAAVENAAIAAAQARARAMAAAVSPTVRASVQRSTSNTSGTGGADGVSGGVGSIDSQPAFGEGGWASDAFAGFDGQGSVSFGDSSDAAGGTGDDATKIVCTAMNEAYGFGSFRQRIWLAHSAKLDPAYQRGYHTIFRPLLRASKTRPWLRRTLEHIARHRTADIWQQRRGKRDRIGACWRFVLEPLCYVVGKLSRS